MTLMQYTWWILFLMVVDLARGLSIMAEILGTTLYMIWGVRDGEA